MAGRLAPSGQRFLPELSMMADLVVSAAGVLRERLSSKVGRPEYAAALAAYVREADRLAAVVTTGAPHALVPPIDAEDATELASRLRDVVDAACRATRLADAVHPDLPDAGAALLAGLLVQATDSLEGAAATLTDPFRALDFARDVRRLVREADRTYGEAIGALVATTSETLAAVRHAEIYRALRESFRACAHAAAVIEHIVLKRF